MVEVPRPYYTRALQHEAVRRVLEGKRPDHVARELALSEKTVLTWMDDAADLPIRPEARNTATQQSDEDRDPA